MELRCRNQLLRMENYSSYCCRNKKELLRNNNFEKSIGITPRVIICKSFTKYETYYQSLQIQNLGQIPRRMKFFVDPGSDVSFKTEGNPELTAGASITIEICVEPRKKNNINLPRYFYALTAHPDIVFEVPILVLKTPPEVFVPSSIYLYKVPANTTTHFQFIIYNPFECDLQFTTHSTFENIKISKSEEVLLARNFCKILLTANIPNQILTESVVVKINGKCYKIDVHMEPSDKIIHLSSHALEFSDMYMGFKQKKALQICNKSLEDVSFEWTPSANSQSTQISTGSEELRLNDILTIKTRRGCISSLSSALSIITLSPPIAKFSEEEEPPYKINVTIYLRCPLINSQFYQLQILGTILGPNIDISPADTDLGNIYVGQVICLSFEVTNKGPINGEMYAKECTDEEDIKWTITPRSINLEPGQKGAFALKLYRKNLGRFLTKFTFKIRCGKAIPILLRGNSLAAHVKIWPDSFELSEIPVCVPQKRFALIANPLPVPIVVEPSVLNEGTEDPLMLCEDYSNIFLHTKPTLHKISLMHDDEEMIPCFSDFEINKSNAVGRKMSDVSCLFKDKILDDIPAIADEFLQNIKQQSPQHQPEPATKIIDVALDCILSRLDNFEELREKQNFKSIDWEILPKNPKEIAIEYERFYLKPNESKSFPIVLIPNSVGPNSKTIQFRSCPLGVDQNEIKTAINSSNMTTTLRLEYNCVVPDVVHKDEIRFNNTVYVDKSEKFEMQFTNIQNVPVFIYFKPLPDTIFGSLEVSESHQKCLIQHGQTITVPATVTYRKVGNVSLAGVFKIVGRHTDCAFTIVAEVLPPKVHITPGKLFKKQRVLESTRAKVLIENTSPTIAKFSVSLANDANQHVEPLGGHLAPGQKILLLVSSRFSDPGVYKNLIHVHLIHAEDISIPIQFRVDGIPLTFSPNIKRGFDWGTIYRCDEGQECHINIWNDGKISYRVIFIKQKPKGNLVPPVFSNVLPQAVIINPKDHASVKLFLDTSKRVQVDETYSVDVVGEDNNRYKYVHFSCKCDVIEPKIIWNKPEVHLDYGNEHFSDSVAIANAMPLKLNVNLAVSGFFSLIDPDTLSGNKTYNFKLEGKTTRHLLVEFNATEKDVPGLCQFFDGIVNCKANGIQQKNLKLYAKIIYPKLDICNPKVQFFTQNFESYAHITLRNDGSLPAKFHWKTGYTRICQTACKDTYKRSCAKTISEIILNLPDEYLPCIPKLINTTSEICSSNDEYYEDNNEESIIKDESNQSFLSVRAESKTSSLILDEIKNDLASMEGSKHIFAKKDQADEPLKSSFKLKESSQYSLSYLDMISHAVQIEQIFHYLGVKIRKQENISVQTNTHQFGEYGQGDRERLVVKFQDKKGVVLPKTIHKAYIFLPCIPKGWTFIGKYSLEVERGETKRLDLSVSNLKGGIHISQSDINVGRQIWFKTLSQIIDVTNPCPHAIKIKIIDMIKKCDIHEMLIKGSLNVTSQKCLIVMPGKKYELKCQVLLGLCFNFVDDIRIEVNNNTTGIPIQFHGSGLMPMIFPMSLNSLTRKSMDTIENYLTIRNVYNDFKSKNNSKHGLPRIEDTEESNVSTSITMQEEEDLELNNLSDTYAIQYPQKIVELQYSEVSGPKALEIERLIETLKFKAEMEKCSNLKQHFYQYFCKCMCFSDDEFNPVVNLNLTICRPVPWELSAYVLHMGDIAMNESRHFQIYLTFLGPGRVFLSARTKIDIPGLMVWFNNCHDTNHSNSFIFYMQSPKENKQKLYRNQMERDIESWESQSGAKLTHAHSFDFDSSGVHKRERRASRDLKTKEHYNKISYPNKVVKDPLILAEICQVDNGDWHDTTFQLDVLFTALESSFMINQVIDDYLLIDVHLGPTLPIQMKGRIICTSSNQIKNQL